jgi:hypothetical protein
MQLLGTSEMFVSGERFAMNSAARFLVLAAACTTLLVAGAAMEPASAQEVCKDNTVTASGRAKFRPFTKTKELEGRGSAMADAVVNWQREVREKYGDRWDTWSRAKGTSFECAPTKTGKIIGSSFIGCTISGKPCSSGSSKAADDGDRRDGRDRWRRRLRTAYEMEMAYQDRLAERRKRAEDRLWAREDRYQKYLARKRERDAIWAFRRSTYYGEYGTYRRYRAYNRYRSYRYPYRHYGHHHYGYRHYSYDRYCDCAPYSEYRFTPLFDFGFFHRSSYHCAEP